MWHGRFGLSANMNGGDKRWRERHTVGPGAMERHPT